MIEIVKKEIQELLKSAGVTGELEITSPPKKEMGDFAFGCFALSKEYGRPEGHPLSGKNPAEIAAELAKKIEPKGLISRVEAVGPYINFYINSSKFAEELFKGLDQTTEKYGKSDKNAGKKLMFEFAHPNTHKAFHIGHLRGVITGESIIRILENSGYQVVRTNYQGDVGMHIAKCFYGLSQMQDEYQSVKDLSLEEKVSFLGKAYAHGGQAFEDSEDAKAEIISYNDKIYSRDSSIEKMYKTTRDWSLEYFDKIYQRLGTHFDRLYFESEVYERGLELVDQFLEKGIFKKSEGAIIFEGSRHGLHDRVFVNSKGFPTYEGKEMALAEMQLSEYKIDKVVHLTGKEQADYFKVVIKAIESIFPDSVGKEEHITYGWVRLKHGKMSSRTGQVVLGEWLLDEIEKKIEETMKDRQIKDKEDLLRKIGVAATKYSMLKTGVQSDIAFDIDETVSTTGDSGPYLLYIITRIKSILKKANLESDFEYPPQQEIKKEEKQLLLDLAKFPEIVLESAQDYDPSQIARYLFGLAQDFNAFYQECSVVNAETEEIKKARVKLIQAVEMIMERGLFLLGIEHVEEM